MGWLAAFYRSTVGKKFFIATTGIILFLFVLLHMIGNLQIFLGPEKLNDYGKLLHYEPALLWLARAVLLLCVLTHFLAAVQLTVQNWGSRPMRYALRNYREADYAARTMIWTGPIVAAFIVYHLMHLTLGTVHPSFIPGDVYHNVVTGFQVWPVAAFYILANILLGVHLYHGLWSLFQTLGLNHPAYNRWRRVAAVALSALIVAGNVSIPLAVLAGVVS